MNKSHSLVVMCSGNGSNLQAIIHAIHDGRLPHTRIAKVIVNNPEAYAITRAQQAHIPTAIIDHKAFSSRQAFEQQLHAEIDAAQPDLIVLAGFMRVLTSEFVNAYPQKIINIHPSLLPAYKGLHTHQRVLITGERYHGCTTHFVTAALDAGQIIRQKQLQVPQHATAESLQQAVHLLEHQLLVETLQQLTQHHA